MSLVQVADFHAMQAQWLEDGGPVRWDEQKTQWFQIYRDQFLNLMRNNYSPVLYEFIAQVVCPVIELGLVSPSSVAQFGQGEDRLDQVFLGLSRCIDEYPRCLNDPLWTDGSLNRSRLQAFLIEAFECLTFSHPLDRD